MFGIYRIIGYNIISTINLDITGQLIHKLSRHLNHLGEIMKTSGKQGVITLW
jgi:hypothetical protein